MKEKPAVAEQDSEGARGRAQRPDRPDRGQRLKKSPRLRVEARGQQRRRTDLENTTEGTASQVQSAMPKGTGTVGVKGKVAETEKTVNQTVVKVVEDMETETERPEAEGTRDKVPPGGGVWPETGEPEKEESETKRTVIETENSVRESGRTVTEGTKTKGTVMERKEIRGTVADIEKVTIIETGKTHSEATKIGQ